MEENMKEEYSNQHRRWYDKDPVLSQAMNTLEHSDDDTQIRIALNLIKIITIKVMEIVERKIAMYASINYLVISIIVPIYGFL